MKQRILRLGLVATIALIVPAAAVAHGPQDGLSVAAGKAQHSLPTSAGKPEGDEGTDSDTNDETGTGDRPLNHGWYVSQAAKDHSKTGGAHNNHGGYVSGIAKSDQGKPAAATSH